MLDIYWMKNPPPGVGRNIEEISYVAVYDKRLEVYTLDGKVFRAQITEVKEKA